MSLYKPGKERTVNFIYCWAALHLGPSRGSAPYSQKLGDVFGVWPDKFASSTGLKHSCPPEGAPEWEWAFQALCLSSSSRPHRAPSLWPGFSTPPGSRTSQEGKPGPQDSLSPLGWKPTQKPPHPPTRTSQATVRRRRPRSQDPV